jgi:hypothetical protein
MIIILMFFNQSELSQKNYHPQHQFIKTQVSDENVQMVVASSSSSHPSLLFSSESSLGCSRVSK